MKTLIVYYSKTGNTRLVAETLAQNLGADLEEISESQPKIGIIGILLLCKDSIMHSPVSINELKHRLSDYDTVVIGTPVWAWSMSNPIRSFIKKHKQDLKKVAFFATMGGNGDKRTFSHMEKLSGLAPLATVSFTDNKIKSGVFKDEIIEFIKKLS